MKQLSFVDLHYLIDEFKVLENNRVDSFYSNEDIFYIRVYVRSKGHMYLTNRVSKFIYLGTSKEESAEPKSFIKYLRKYLKNSFIREISQIPDERIIKIKFEAKKEEIIHTFYLYLELFANGNIILTDENNEIKNSLHKKKFKDRTVMVRDKYQLPPQKELSLTNLNEKTLKEQLEQTDLSIVKFLAMKIGMGGKYSEEVCKWMGIDKNSDSKNVNVKDLTKNLNQLLKQKLNPHSLKQEKDIKDFYPFEFNSIQNLTKEESFNEVVKTYFNQFSDEKDKREDQMSKDLKKLQNRLLKQETQQKEVQVKYKEQSNIGNKIYENYTLIEDLLTSINKASKEKGWGYVQDKINSDEKLSKIIKKLDYKNNKIELELE